MRLEGLFVETCYKVAAINLSMSQVSTNCECLMYSTIT